MSCKDCWLIRICNRFFSRPSPSDISLVPLLQTDCSLLTKHERESASTTSWLGPASVTKGGSVCHPELGPPEPGSQPVEEVAEFTWGSTRLAGRWWAPAGTGPARWWGCGCWGMWRLLRKKERQRRGVREHRRQRNRKKEEARPRIYMHMLQMLCLGRCRNLHNSIPHMICSGHGPVFNNCFFSSISSTETSISSFRPVEMSNRKSDWRPSQESESHSPRLAVFIKAHNKP